MFSLFIGCIGVFAVGMNVGIYISHRYIKYWLRWDRDCDEALKRPSERPDVIPIGERNGK